MSRAGAGLRGLVVALALCGPLTAAATTAALPRPAAAQPVNIIGPCRDGFRWLATAVGIAPVAAFADCATNVAEVQFACGGLEPELRLYRALPELPPGMPVVLSVTVDGQVFALPARTGYVDRAGTPFLRAPLTAPAVAALVAGNAATIALGATQIEMHLAASSEALNLLAHHC